MGGEAKRCLLLASARAFRAALADALAAALGGDALGERASVAACGDEVGELSFAACRTRGGVVLAGVPADSFVACALAAVQRAEAGARRGRDARRRAMDRACEEVRPRPGSPALPWLPQGVPGEAARRRGGISTGLSVLQPPLPALDRAVCAHACVRKPWDEARGVLAAALRAAGGGRCAVRAEAAALARERAARALVLWAKRDAREADEAPWSASKQEIAAAVRDAYAAQARGAILLAAGQPEQALPFLATARTLGGPEHAQLRNAAGAAAGAALFVLGAYSEAAGVLAATADAIEQRADAPRVAFVRTPAGAAAERGGGDGGALRASGALAPLTAAERLWGSPPEAGEQAASVVLPRREAMQLLESAAVAAAAARAGEAAARVAAAVVARGVCEGTAVSAANEETLEAAATMAERASENLAAALGDPRHAWSQIARRDAVAARKAAGLSAAGTRVGTKTTRPLSARSMAMAKAHAASKARCVVNTESVSRKVRYGFLRMNV